MKQEVLKIEGMGCNHCVMAVKNELEKLNSLIIEKVEPGYAKIHYDDSAISKDDLKRAIEDAGYKLSV